MRGDVGGPPAPVENVDDHGGERTTSGQRVIEAGGDVDGGPGLPCLQLMDDALAMAHRSGQLAQRQTTFTA
ncbi:hypothetical protein Vlu01_11940 [Micromonospora lutea]|uniref:Uncharacterized protein n=1 Tax=Micromonospora lutea TaxID=419825 RepID=A0ABQ4IRX6_9ACTN|nr:hypothetical protein Vlu01_11940 [Micromonospora lutea]